MSGGSLGGGVDLDVALNSFMTRDLHEVDAMDNFLERCDFRKLYGPHARTPRAASSPGAKN